MSCLNVSVSLKSDKIVSLNSVNLLNRIYEYYPKVCIILPKQTFK